MLGNLISFDNIKVLDLFAGTGNISLEFISRGAESVISVDQDKACTIFIRQTAARLEIANLKIVRSDVFRFLDRAMGSFDVIFADPPYSMDNKASLIEVILNSGRLGEKGLFILEHPKEEDYSKTFGFHSTRRYGNVNFSFFHSTLAKTISDE